MGKKLLVREAKRIALLRMEEAARTKDEWNDVIVQWNQLDRNRERRERYNEVSRPNALMLHWDKTNPNDENGKLKSFLEVVIPQPLRFYWWRQILAGDFLETIYDNPNEMWQIIEDWDIASIIKTLTDKQKVVMYYSFVRLLSSAEVADMQNKTDRAVRKLRAATLEKIQDELFLKIERLVKAKSPELTFDKGIFYSIYKEKKQKAALDKTKSD